MKIGVVYPQTELGGDPRAVRDIAMRVEELGYSHLLAYDHPLGAVQADRVPRLAGPYSEKDPFHDPFVMFAYLAGLSRRLEFVAGVLVLPQRQTALVARQAADLDLLSGERFTLGAGVGWNWAEYQALGSDFHTRGKRLEEQVTVLRRLWSGEATDFRGEFHRIDRVAVNPAPRRQIPIYLGGAADIALRRAARIADGFIFTESFRDAFDSLERLHGHLKENGRAGADFGKHLIVRGDRKIEEVPDVLSRWRDCGGTHASILTMGRGLANAEDHADHISRMAEALKGLRAG